MKKKIRVLFDANPLVRQKTGIGFYTEGIIKALARSPELELTGHYFRLRGAKPKLPVADNLRYTSNPWLIGQLVKALRKIGIRLPWEVLSRSRGDVLFFPDFTSWPSLFGTPKLLTIHDLTFVDHPEYVARPNLKFLRRYVQKDARRAALILTISQFTKGRLEADFGLKGEKVIVEPIPPPKPTTQAAKRPKISGLPDKYILFVGTLEPRKNFESLATAYASLPQALKQEYGLVLAGGYGWEEAGFAAVKSLQSQGENILLTGYIDDNSKEFLYQNASLFILPSHYEGFGMPILEAMSFGVPTAVSNLRVFHEVAGDAAIYFNQDDIAGIAKALEAGLTNKRLRAQLIRKANSRLKKYNWDDIAKRLIAELDQFRR